MNENFYLACENADENYPFTKFRVSNIGQFTVSTKTFHKNYEIEEFIKSMQTPFSTYMPNFKQHLINITVEVENSKAKFFKAKKFLLSQKELEVKDNGNLIFSYTVTQQLEMEELVKKWIPYMRIIEPISLKNKIDEDIKKMLKIAD